MTLASSVFAQNAIDNPDWAEEKTPQPPKFSKENLIMIEMPSYVSIKVGVDPSTIVVGADGIVRYVVVMQNVSGTVNAAYEGIRCFTDEVKTYARVGTSGEWSLMNEPQWLPVNGNTPSKHSYVIARQGACDARTASNTLETIKALKTPRKTGLAKPVF
jgi:hypothetical protein